MSRHPSAPFPKRPSDVPVTQKMLYRVRDEILGRTGAEASGLRTEFTELRGEFTGFRTEFTGLRAEFSELRAELRADIARIGVLVEEQNARNAIVLEGLSGLFHRQERIEKRTDGTEAILAKLAKGTSPGHPSRN